MRQIKATGPHAAALKYDILTALLSLSMRDKGVDGRLAHRLTLLITARFNWRTETFSIGMHEIARLWSVTDRTAKRELALMRARNWIVVHRAAARGRVTEHRVNMTDILDATRTSWANVGPDFVERMGQGGKAPDQNSTVVPFPAGKGSTPVSDGSVWGSAAVLLHEAEPALYAAWFARLQEIECRAGQLVLAAPSRFVASYVAAHFRGRLLAVLSGIDASIIDIDIIAAD